MDTDAYDDHVISSITGWIERTAFRVNFMLFTSNSNNLRYRNRPDLFLRAGKQV